VGSPGLVAIPLSPERADIFFSIFKECQRGHSPKEKQEFEKRLRV
jgi:hypothetical protein